MSLLAVVLVCVSAFIHAGWNLVGKQRRPSGAFFLLASVSGAVLLSPWLLLDGGAALWTIPLGVWLLLGLTGLFMSVYYVALAGAYRAGDMSLAYPLARSSPVILVTIAAVAMGRGHEVTFQCIAGIAVVVTGCMLLPMRRFSDVRLANYLNPTCALALVAAVGTAGYSVVDDEALRLLRGGDGGTFRATQLTLLYACLESLSAAAWLMVFIATLPSERRRVREALRTDARHAIAAGVAICVAYALVLVALAHARNVSYVVALRQLSVLLGALLAIGLLKEAPHRPKLVGVAVAFVGLVLVATG